MRKQNNFYLRVSKEPTKYRGGAMNSGTPTIYDVEVMSLVAISDGFIAVEIEEAEPDTDVQFRCSVNVMLPDETCEKFEIVTDGETYRHVLEEHSGRVGSDYINHMQPLGHRLNWGDKQMVKSVIENSLSDKEIHPD